MACWRDVARTFGLRLSPAPAVTLYCCNYFAVTRERIRRFPLAIWRRAYEKYIVNANCSALSHVDFGKHDIAGTFEHLAHMIWGGHAERMEVTVREGARRKRDGARAAARSVEPAGDFCAGVSGELLAACAEEIEAVSCASRPRLRHVDAAPRPVRPAVLQIASSILILPLPTP